MGALLDAASADSPAIHDEATLDPRTAPTLAEIERLVARLPQGKAMGEDGIPPGHLEAIPTHAARLLHPLFLKAAATRTEPIQWQGGNLIPIPKPSSTADPATHRGILVSDHIGKTFHRITRRLLGETFGHYATDSQCWGGRKAGHRLRFPHGPSHYP